MRSWTKVSIKLVEILGQHLQTPEYLKCCGIESNDAPTRNRTTPNQLQCNQPEPSYLTAKPSTNLPACPAISGTSKSRALEIFEPMPE